MLNRDIDIGPDGFKRKVGRPFKGLVEEFSKEPHVPERRSVLRAFKKYYAKREFSKSHSERMYIENLCSGFTDFEKEWIIHYVNVCKQTQSADHYRKKAIELENLSKREIDSIQNKQNMIDANFTFPTDRPPSLKTGKYNYDPLVGDPCYRYNKGVKEKFFKNVFLAYLFIQFAYYNGQTFTKKKLWRVENKTNEKMRIIILKDIIWEFISLGLKTIERNPEIYGNFKRKIEYQK